MISNIITQVDETTWSSLYDDSSKYLSGGNVDIALQYTKESLQNSVNALQNIPNGTIVLVTEDKGKPLALLAGILVGGTYDVHFCLFARNTAGSYTELFNITVEEKQALMHPLGIQQMRYHVYGENMKAALITKNCSIESENADTTIMIPEGF